MWNGSPWFGGSWFGPSWYGGSEEDETPVPNSGGIVTVGGFTYVDETEPTEHTALQVGGKVLVI